MLPVKGHVHFYLDVSPIPSDPSKPAIPADANAVWAHVSGTSYTFTNVSPGMHTITVQLANNDHTPVIPLATASVMVTATSGTVTATPVATTAFRCDWRGHDKNNQPECTKYRVRSVDNYRPCRCPYSHDIQ